MTANILSLGGGTEEEDSVVVTAATVAVVVIFLINDFCLSMRKPNELIGNLLSLSVVLSVYQKRPKNSHASIQDNKRCCYSH
jgi:hypothetical protein